jgi:hypothetical protein
LTFLAVAQSVWSAADPAFGRGQLDRLINAQASELAL